MSESEETLRGRCLCSPFIPVSLAILTFGVKSEVRPCFSDPSLAPSHSSGLAQPQRSAAVAPIADSLATFILAHLVGARFGPLGAHTPVEEMNGHRNYWVAKD